VIAHAPTRAEALARLARALATDARCSGVADEQSRVLLDGSAIRIRGPDASTTHFNRQRTVVPGSRADGRRARRADARAPVAASPLAPRSRRRAEAPVSRAPVGLAETIRVSRRSILSGAGGPTIADTYRCTGRRRASDVTVDGARTMRGPSPGMRTTSRSSSTASAARAGSPRATTTTGVQSATRQLRSGTRCRASRLRDAGGARRLPRADAGRVLAVRTAPGRAWWPRARCSSSSRR
jgi:hypothetical protein